MRRPLALTLLFAALATALFFLWKSIGEVTAPVSVTPAVARTEGPAEKRAETTLVAGDEPAALEIASEASRITANAPAAAASADRTETFPLDGARWIEGRVQFPPGTPQDESVEIWAISPAIHTGQRNSGWTFDAHSLARTARASESSPWAVRTVESNGAFKVPYPAGENANIALVGRYVYLAEIVVSNADEPAEPLVLSPELGGWLVVRCTPPVGFEADLVGSMSTVEGYRMDSVRMRRSNGFVRRTSTVSSDLGFEEGGLPTDLRVTVIVSPTKLAIATRSDFKLEPGRRTELVIDVERGGTVRGRVKDDQGAPVAGAVIESEEQRFNFAPGAGNSQRTTQASADGTYELAGLRAGKTHLSVQHDAYVSGKSDEFELANGAVALGIDIVLPRGNRLAGKVTWPDGTPAGGAQVSARGRSDPPPAARRTRPRRFQSKMAETRSALAGDDGAFAITGLGDGPFVVQAGKQKVDDGPLWVATLHDVAPGASELAFVLEAPKGLAGRVVDDTDAPVTSFHVTAMTSFEQVTTSDASGNRISEVQLIDTSPRFSNFESEDGRFLLEGLQDGRYTVSIKADGYQQTGEKPTVFIPQPDAELVIRVVRTGSVSGRVVDPGGRPIAGAKVSARTPNSARNFDFFGDDASADSGADGAFTIESVPTGTMEILADAEDWAKSEPLTVTIAPRVETPGLLLTLRSGGRLTGEIYGAGGAASGGRNIQMFSMDAADMRTALSDVAGRFEADHLTPGTYQLVAEPPQKEREELARRMNSEDADPTEFMAQMKMTSATIREGETTHVVMGAPPKAPVKVTGTITRAGEPADARNVMVIGEGGSMLDSFKVGKVDASGRYELTLDKPGNVVLVVSKQFDPGTGIEFYETIPEVPEYRLDLALPLGSIRGRVRGPDRQPLQGVRVQLLSDGITNLSVMTGGGQSVTTDEGGRFSFDDVHPGTFAVAAGGSMGRRFMSEDSPHGRSVRGGLRVEADKVLDGIELELSKPGTLTGRVLDADGAPVPGATVYVRDAQGELLHRFSAYASDGNGHFEYEGVAPGKYTACARTSTLAGPDSNPVSVHEGQSSEVDLLLEPGTWVRISMEDGDLKNVRANVSVKNEHGQEFSGMFSFDAIQTMMTEGISSTEKRVGPLPAGKYVVTATLKDGRTAKKSITLKGQDERKVVLRFD